ERPHPRRARAVRGRRRRAPRRACRRRARAAGGTVELNLLERRIARVRLVAVPFAIFQVAVTAHYPPGYAAWAWVTTAAFVVGPVGFAYWARVDLAGRAAVRRGLVALGFDFAILSSYVLAYSWERDTPTRQLLFFPMLEGCFRFAVLGGVVMALLTAP